jgi:lysophospholipase L1-like esterase
LRAGRLLGGVALAMLVLAVALAALLAPVAGAATKPHRLAPTPPVQIGRVVLSAPNRSGGAALLVPVRYPIEFSGRWVRVRVSLWRGARKLWAASVPVRLSAGPPRVGDRRRSFTYVHRVSLDPGRARGVRLGNLQVHAEAGGNVDVNADGKAELHSVDSTAPLLALTPAQTKGALCSSVPQFAVPGGRTVSHPLPACSRPLRWRVADGPEGGRAWIEGGRFFYRAPRGRSGADSLVLRGLPVGRAGEPGVRAARGGAEAGVPVPVSFTVGTGPGLVVRAMGDSVTAGFGYYGDGESMGILNLPECRPTPPYDDACSSNSEVLQSGSRIILYASDYGLTNNISWAAQWANRYGVTNYENLAISGSEPKEWAPGGSLHATTEAIEAEDPDYILMTVGANPLLSEVLFGVDHMGCAIYSDLFGNFAECIESAFAGVGLNANLRKLYTDLVEHTDATVLLMGYPTTIPSVALAYSSAQVAEMGQLLDREIAKVAAEVNPKRLQVIQPPHFNVGVDISPVYPSTYSCSRFGYKVDGPSVQSTPTQDELEPLHPFSFCAGPKPKEPNWVISGDTGIHPSATGYSHMAARLPAPTEG